MLIIKKNKFYKSIYYTLLVVFILIALLLAVFISFYLKAEVKIRHEEEETKFINYYTYMENKIRSFDKSFELLYKNEIIEEFFLQNRKKDYYKQRQIINSISSVAGIISDSNRLYVVDYEDEICFTQNGTYDITDFAGTVDMNSQILDKFVTELEENKVKVVYDEKKKVFLFGSIHRYNADKKIICLMPYNAADFLPVYDQRNMLDLVQINKIEKIKDKKILRALEQVQLSNTRDMYSKYKNIYTYNSEFCEDLIFLYVVDYKSVTLILIIISIISLYLIFCLFGKKIVDNLTGKIYAPVYSLVQLFDDDKLSEISELSDSIQRLISENQMLNAKIELSSKNLKKAYFKEVLFSPFNMTRSDAEKLKLYSVSEYYRVLYLDFEFKNKDCAENISFLYAREYSFEKNVEELVSKIIEGEFIQLEKGKYALIVPSDKIDTDSLVKKSLQIVEMGERIYGVSVFIIIGKSVVFTNIHDSYSSVLDGLEQKFLYGDRSVVCCDIIETKGRMYYPIEVEEELISYILSGKRENANRLLEKIINENFVSRRISKHDAAEFKFALSATIKKIIRALGKTDDELLGEGKAVYAELSMTKTILELQNMVFDIFECLNDYVAKKNDVQSNRMSIKIEKYIQENFASDISLQSASEALYISQGHINRLLRGALNKSFKEYLDEVRITEAKKLLKETQLTIVKISEKVGYLNVNSFIRLFKRLMHVSPGEYRKNNLNIENKSDKK